MGSLSVEITNDIGYAIFKSTILARNTTVNILKHLLSGAQYNNCQPPGKFAHGFLVGSLHGGGTMALSTNTSRYVCIITVIVKMHIHFGQTFITANSVIWTK